MPPPAERPSGHYKSPFSFVQPGTDTRVRVSRTERTTGGDHTDHRSMNDSSSPSTDVYLNLLQLVEATASHLLRDPSQTEIRLPILGETATDYSLRELTGGVCSHPDRDRRSGLHRSVSSDGRAHPVIFVLRIQDLIMSVQRRDPPKRQPLQRFSHSSLFIDPLSRLAPQSVMTSRRPRNAQALPQPASVPQRRSGSSLL